MKLNNDKRIREEIRSLEVARRNLEAARRNMELARQNIELVTPHVKAGMRALRDTMVTFAAIHIGIVVVVSIYQHNLTLLNLFTVIGVDKVWPSSGSGTVNDILSAIVAAVVYFAYFAYIQFKFRPGRAAKATRSSE